MKKTLTFIVVVLSFCLCFVMGANALEADGFEYTVYDGRATVTGYNGYGGDVVIPDTLDGYSVIAIGERAFENCYSITSVTIGSDIVSIGAYAFSECSNLEKIYWNAKEITDIWSYCGGTVFSEAGSMSDRFEVVFGNTVKKIPYELFCDNEYLDSVTIGTFVEHIGCDTFDGCTDIDKIIWNAVDGIGDFVSSFEGVFEYAGTTDGSVSVTFGSAVKDIPQNLFYGCNNLKQLVIPNNVKQIWDHAFEACEYLTSVTIGKSVEYIGDSAFADCYRLNKVNWNAVNPSVEGYSTVFEDCGIVGNGVVAVLGNGVKKVPDYLFYGVKVIQVTLPESLVSIGDYAFKNCRIKTVTIPKNVTYIGSCAFSECLLLEKVYWNAENVSDYGSDVFSGIGTEAAEDVEVIFSDEVMTVPEYAFYDCDTLVKVSVGDTIMIICRGAFDECNNLLEVYFKGSKEQWQRFEIDDGNEPLNEAVFSYGHKHTTETKLTKATLSKNGKSSTKCKTCIYYDNSYTVYRPTDFKLSTTKYTYDGKTKTPSVTVKDLKGKTLKNKTDYTVKYTSDRKSIGKKSVVITFKGKYSGKKTLTYYVLPSKTKKITVTQTSSYITPTWKKVSGASGYKVELLNSKGKNVKTIHTSKLTYKFSKLKAATDYRIRVTAYKTIDKKKVYSVVSTTLKTCTAPTKLSQVFAVADYYYYYPCVYYWWIPVKGASGYEVQYSKYSNMKKAKTIKVGSGVEEVLIEMDSAKSKYYVRARAYRKVGSKKIYGQYTKTVKVYFK